MSLFCGKSLSNFLKVRSARLVWQIPSRLYKRSMDTEVSDSELAFEASKYDEPDKPAYSIQYKKGDLFGCPDSSSLAHCISEDCRMGKGIAVIFKKKFGGVQQLLTQGEKTGGLAVLKRGDRYVYYLVTKHKYFNKPTYESLENSLKRMRDHCLKHKVTEVAMPKIGCGLDRLQWHRVERTLLNVFNNTQVKLTVYEL